MLDKNTKFEYIKPTYNPFAKYLEKERKRLSRSLMIDGEVFLYNRLKKIAENEPITSRFEIMDL